MAKGGIIRSAGPVALALLAVATAGTPARAASDIALCADERVKQEMLPLKELAAAEAACGRALGAAADPADRQKAAFFRGLMRFLQVVQKGAELKPKRDGAFAGYAPQTLEQVSPALKDVESALAIEGPLKDEALALRITINQTIGRPAEAQADIEQATRSDAQGATPFVQRALERERAGDLRAALVDLDHALGIEPTAPTALLARGQLLRRLGRLGPARADLEAAAAAGRPYRLVALMAKSGAELRAGDLRAAYESLLGAARATDGLPKSEAASIGADLLIRAGDFALDKLKEPEAARKHYREAQKLVPRNWNAAIGLARYEESRGKRAEAIAICRRILAETRATPNLPERLLASLLLKRLTTPLQKSGSGPFKSSFETAGVADGAGSPDGLKRVAFIIGESDYAELASLPNARRDAAVMASALAEMGFDRVEIAENLDSAALRGVPAAIEEGVGDADVVLVFYAGHGVETGGANYLIPVNAVPETDADLRTRALALADLTAAAGKARRGSLVIVDACRDDPFVEARAVAQSRGIGGSAVADPAPERIRAGLAATPVTPANGVVLHSTQPGQVALDGDGLESPFVRALLETLGTPGQPFEAVVTGAAARVSERTEGRQLPASYGVSPAVALLPPAAK